MKNFLFFLLAFCTATVGAAQNNVPPAADVLKQAYAKAGSEGKQVLLIFHASWCGWCQKMDASLQDPSVKASIDRSYIIEHLTVHESADKKALENPGAIDFLKKNGGADAGLPYWFVLDKNGKVLADSQRKPGENTGCPASKEEVDYFVDVLRKTSSLKPAELDAIRQRFRLNEQ